MFSGGFCIIFQNNLFILDLQVMAGNLQVIFQNQRAKQILLIMIIQIYSERPQFSVHKDQKIFTS